MTRKILEKLKLKNQILILYSLIVVLIFAILISLSLVLVDKFSIFIRNQLVEQLILKNIMGSMQNAVGSLGRIGQIEYYQQIAEKNSLKNLYDFQVSNNIQMTSQLDNCLETQFSKQFYSYQICYGIYGQKTNKSDLSLIKNFISLQNLFIPFKQLQYNKAYYTLQFDQQLFFSQYQGDYIEVFDLEILKAIIFMAFFEFPEYSKQIQGQMILIFTHIPGTKIAYGTLLDQNQQQFYQLARKMEYYEQRLIGVMYDGLILTDTNNVDQFGFFYEGFVPTEFGYMFQNTSLTGFNETQFEKIKNFTFKNYTVINECELQVQGQILCLVDINQKNKLIFPRNIKNGSAPYLLVTIIDGQSIKIIRDEVNNQLEILNNDIVKNIAILLSVTFAICFILPLVLIRRLNQPLDQLQNIARFHINNQEYKIQKFIRLNKVQSQIQNLADAFFDLINTDNKNKHIQSRNIDQKSIKTFHMNGILTYRYSKLIILQIKRIISNFPTYSYD